MPSLVLILIAVSLGVIGQLFFKAGTSGLRLGFDWSMVRIFFTPRIIIGMTSYGISCALWLKVLSQEALSYAYPLISLSYPMILILSMVFFKEQVTVWRWLGVFLIMLGVYFVGKHA